MTTRTITVHAPIEYRRTTQVEVTAEGYDHLLGETASWTLRLHRPSEPWKLDRSFVGAPGPRPVPQEDRLDTWESPEAFAAAVRRRMELDERSLRRYERKA